MEKKNLTDKVEEGSHMAPDTFYIKVTADGPYLLFGHPEMKEQTIVLDDMGVPCEYREGKAFDSKEPCALCRCGASTNKPYCTGNHASTEWNPKEKASHEPLLKDVDVYEGPLLTLADNEKFCAFARFCDVDGKIWNIVESADDESDVELAKRIVGNCPGGRLVLWDKKARKIYEPDYSPSIGLIEDPGIKVSGPIWVRGGIRVIGANGSSYEIRNRVTLCRCGRSENKPFCDGSHAEQ